MRISPVGVRWLDFQPDRLDLDAHDLSLLRFLEHRVERVRLGPAVYRRVDSVRNGSPRFDGAFGHVRIDAQV